MNIRVETSSLATPHQSGVAAYTRLLTEALAAQQDVAVSAHYFNFFHRQPQPLLDNTAITFEQNPFVPLRVYAKLQSFSAAPPFDMFLPQTDLTIFPNFATWPTVHSKLSATVIHDLTYVYYPELVEEANLAHLRRVVPRSVAAADIVITVSESVKGELVREFGLDPEKCVVTPIPPSDIFRQECDAKKRESVRNKYGLGQKKYIFFLGNFEPRKNLETLITAYTQLPKSLQADYQLVLAGGKGWKSEKTQQALDAAVASGADIQHIGYVDDADRPALYQAASLFVMPSLYEGFGIPILEAMLSGCPVVAADIPVLRETGGDGALYADPSSASSFAKVIEQALVSYPYSAQDMHRNTERFSWHQNVSLLLKKANALLDRKP